MGTIAELIREIKGKDALLCFLAIALSGYSIMLLNTSIYSEVATYFGLAREINTLFSGLAFLTLFFVAQKRPSLLEGKQMILIACGSVLASFCILLFAIDYQIPSFTVIGLCFATIGKAWGTVVISFSLCSLKSTRGTVAIIAAGIALGELLVLVLPVFSFGVGVCLTSLMALFVLLSLYKTSAPLLEKVVHGETPNSLELSNPESFIEPIHALYFCVLLFSFASGYALTLGEVEHAPTSTDLVAIAMIFVALWISLSTNPKKEDSLFLFSALLIIAGFLIAPFTFFGELSTANILIRTGIISFEMLLWMTYASIGKRNIFALLPTLALISFMKSIGTDAGAITGHASNDLVGSNSELAALLAAVALFVFVAFLLVGFKNFSFSETISGVTSVNVSEPLPNADHLEERCAAISAEKGLTERESEIFAMLARGRNGQFVMEHYVISRNTVKSHIKHIYQKLDVHSQQELIDLVEPSQAA